MIKFKSFSQWLKEDLDAKDKEKIAIIPGSFKPPHVGHLDMVKKYANKVDNVIVIISSPQKKVRKTSTGKIISPEVSKKIWDIYIKSTHLTNVDVTISSKPSPVGAAVDWIIDNAPKNCIIYLGSSTKDDYDKQWQSLIKYIDKYRPDVTIADLKETAVEPYKSKDGTVVSATFIRDNITEPDKIKKYLPDIPDSEIDKVVDLLS